MGVHEHPVIVIPNCKEGSGFRNREISHFVNTFRPCSLFRRTTGAEIGLLFSIK